MYAKPCYLKRDEINERVYQLATSCLNKAKRPRTEEPGTNKPIFPAKFHSWICVMFTSFTDPRKDKRSIFRNIFPFRDHNVPRILCHD